MERDVLGNIETKVDEKAGLLEWEESDTAAISRVRLDTRSVSAAGLWSSGFVLV